MLASSGGIATGAQTTRTWAEVDLGRISHNVRVIQEFIGDRSFLLAVLKADAYGHGAERVARECARAGVTHFGVASIAEGLELRDAGLRDADILVLSPFLPEEASALVGADLVPMVSSAEQLEALFEASGGAPRPIRCFLKIDTGMGRSGSLPADALHLWRRIESCQNLRVTGIATHFSSADEPEATGYPVTETQIGRFRQFVADCADEGLIDRAHGGIWLSLANSPATLRHAREIGALADGARGLLVRAGLLLYGIEPYPNAFTAAGIGGLLPALSWKARVTLLRDLPEGATVGYGCTYTLTRPSRVATIAAGYADGLSRRLSSRGHVLIRGRRYPIIGRVSMDQTQIDVTDAPAPVRLGESAILIGESGGERQTALDLALAEETTPHEPTCALSRRVPRLYVRSADIFSNNP